MKPTFFISLFVFLFGIFHVGTSIAASTYIQFSYVKTDVTCFGANDGSVMISSVSGGTAPYNFNWSNGTSQQNLTNVAPGYYNLTITDAVGENRTYPFHITGPTQLNLNVLVNQSVNPGYSNGALEIQASGGILPYIYQWSNGGSSALIQNLNPGAYSLTLTDANGCIVTITDTISSLSGISLSASISATDVDCYGDATGSCDVSAAGGNPPYYYSWSNGASTQHLENLPAGNYQVTVFDGGNPQPGASFGVTYLYGSTGSPSSCSLLFSWSDFYINGPDIGVGDVLYASYMESGIERYAGKSVYTSSSGNDALSIWGDDATTPFEKEGLTFGQAIQLKLWSKRYNQYVPVQVNYASNSVIQGTFAYNSFALVSSLTCTLQPTNSSIQILNTTVNQSSDFNISTTTQNANIPSGTNGSIQLSVSSATPPYTYSWSNTETTSSVSGLLAGLYAVTVMDALNCMEMVNVELGLDGATPFEPSTQVTDILCAGFSNGGISVSAAGGIPPYAYTWSNGINSANLTNLSAGIYTVTIFDSGIAQPGNSVPWYYTPTSQYQSIKIPVSAIYLNGLPYSGNGDLGAFYHENGNYACGGYGAISGDTLQLLIYGDNVSTSQKDGFYPGESIVWQLNTGSSTFIAHGIQLEAPSMPISFLSGSETMVSFLNAPFGNVQVESVELFDPAPLTISASTQHEYTPPGTNGKLTLTTSGGTPPYSYNWSDGSTIEDRTGLVAGTYQVTVSDVNGCHLIRNFTLDLITLSPITATYTIQNNICNSGCDGTLDLFPQGGYAPYHYIWSNGATTEEAGNLCAGTYTVTVSDSLTGIMTMPFSFVNTGQNHALFFYASAVNISGLTPTSGDYLGVFFVRDGQHVCGGYAAVPLSGNSALTAWGDDVMSPIKDGFSIGETFKLKYWKASTGTLINLNASYMGGFSNGGDYQINGLSGISSLSGTYVAPPNTPLVQSFTVTQPTPMLISPSIQHAIGTYSNGSISVFVSNGHSPYSYNWSNGETSFEINSLSPGTYTVTVTDAESCMYIESYTINGNTQATPLVSSPILSGPVCHDDSSGIIYANVSGGIPPYLYTWSTGASTSAIQNIPAGTYTVTVSSSLSPVAPFNWTYTQTNFHANILFTMNVNGQPADLGDVVGAFYIDTATGLYHCGGYGTVLDSNGTIYGFDVYGDNPSTPEKDGFAQGDPMSFKIYRFGSGTVQWISTINVTFTTGFSLPIFYAISGGHVCGSFEAYFSNPPLYPQQFIQVYTLQNPPILSSTLTPSFVNPMIGNNGAINLTVNGGAPPYTFNWFNGQTTEDVVSLSYGNYSVSVADANGCMLTNSTEIGFDPQPAPLSITSIYNNISCAYSQDGSIQVSVSGGDIPYTYHWSNGSTNSNLSNLAEGTYTLTVSCVSDTLIAGFVIIEPEQLAVSEAIVMINPAVANDGEIILTPQGGSPPYYANWSNGAQGLSVSGLSYGTYGYTLTDVLGCSVSSSVLVDFSGLYLFFDVDTTMVSCHGYSDGSLSLSNVSAIPPVSYAWSTGSTDMQISGLAAGIYTLTITTGSGDVASYDFTIIEPQVLELGVQSADIHPINNLYGWIQINPSGGTPPYTYLWNNGSTQQNLEGLTIGSYTCDVIDSQGCTSSETVSITYLITPIWQFEETPLVHELDIPEGISLVVNGVASEFGDFIGAFYDSSGTLSCAGYTMWTGDSTRIKIYGNYLSGTAKNGFDPGELIQYKLFDISTMTSYVVSPEYDLTYPNEGYFVNSGLSGLASLETVTISGSVSTSSKSLVNAGMVVLYEVPEEGVWYAKSKVALQNGTFTFTGIPAGNYSLFVVPVPSQHLALPGYYPESPGWEDATSILADSYHPNHNIVLNPVQPYAGGTGAISGIVYAGTESGYNPDVFGDEWFAGLKDGSEVPARNMPVILYDAQMNPLDFRLTNAEGVFQYDQVEFGTYHVGVEKAGLSTEKVEITLSEIHPDQSLIFSMSNGQIIHTAEESPISLIQAFPNPANDFVMIKGLKSGDSYQLHNVLGDCISSQTAVGDMEHVSLEGLASGVYYIRIKSGPQTTYHPVIKSSSMQDE